MRAILFGFLFLGALAPAQDLRLYYRQANENCTSTIYLVPNDPDAKLRFEDITSGRVVSRAPQVLLLMPRPGVSEQPSEIGREYKTDAKCESSDIATDAATKGGTEAKEKTQGSVSLCNVPNSPVECAGDKLQTLQGKPFLGAFVKIVTDRVTEDKLNKYPGNLSDGHRFEAILTLKNIWINDRPTTQTIVVPTTLALTFLEGDSIYEDGVITFRVLYVPKKLEGPIGQRAFWEPAGLPDGVYLDGVSCFQDDALCPKAEAMKSRALHFYLPNLVRQPAGAISFAPKIDRSANRFADTAFADLGEDIVKPLKEQVFRYTRPPQLGQGVTPLPTDAGKLGRPHPFLTNAAVVSQDLPLFLRAAYTYNRAKPTGRHVFNIEAAFAADSDFSLPPIKQTALTQLLFSPQFKLDLNTARTLDNPNSITWNAPITLRRYLPGKYASNAYRPPHFRMISLTSGIMGEHSVYGQSQNIIIPVKGMVRYSTRPGAWRFAFDVRGGPEMGYSMTEKIDRIVLEDPDLVENPAEFVRKITLKNRNIRRLALETKVNLTQGKKASLQFQWQYRKLFRDEQYITERDVKGTFTPGAGQDFFGIAGIPTTYTVLDTGQDMRIRRYMEANFQYALTESFSIDIVYKRGVKPPTFQMVNQVMIGFSFSLGKPKE